MKADPIFEETTLDRAIRFRDGLIQLAIGKGYSGGNATYRELRQFFGLRSDTNTKLPDFIRRYSSLHELQNFVLDKHDTFQERRELIQDAFRPLIEYLEADERTPGVAPIGDTLEAFDHEHVYAAWQKALDRRIADPEGAITAARTLLETVCKHILDDANVEYADDADLPKLWALAAEKTNLAPSQHQEVVFRSILGNCQSVVSNLAAIRNRIGDAHGQGRRPVKPKARHAELAVNLAGTMASFLVATWAERNNAP